MTPLSRRRLSHAAAAISFALAAVSPPLADAAKPSVSKAAADRAVAAVEDFYGKGASASQVYVGSEICLACHKETETWRRTLHATGLKTVADDSKSMKVKDGIIFDANKNGIDDFKDGLDFNTITSAFDRYKPNAPVLRYEAGKGYSVRIGRVEFPVVFAHGGSGLYKQRVVVRIPVIDTPDKLSAGVYESPVQFNETSQTYVVYNAQYWYTADNQPVYGPTSTAKDAAKSNSFHKLCSGCHSTSVTVFKDANDEYLSVTPPVLLAQDDDNHYLDLDFDGGLDMYNTGCERCHGPGGQHVLGRGDKNAIINPANLAPKQQNELCGGCHSRGVSKPTGLHEFPYDETTHTDYAGGIGESLFDRFFTVRAGIWPDGETSRQHHQQLNDLMKSAKWEFEAHKTTCADCHSPHANTPSQLRETVTVADVPSGNPLTFNVKDNVNLMCLSCHAGFGPFAAFRRAELADLRANATRINTAVRAHSHHAFNVENARQGIGCTNCHMAKMAASGDPYDMSSHTFKVVPPDATLKSQAAGGQPNSCATCHRTFAQRFSLPADQSISNWTETSDVRLAEFLKNFYGPAGAWWKKE